MTEEATSMRASRLLGFALFVFCGFLCACGGNALPTTPAASTNHEADVRFTFAIPGPGTRSHHASDTNLARKPQYISAATTSISITLNTVNGATPSPVPSARVIDVTSSTNGCGADTQNTGNVLCAVSLSLPIGSDALTIATYGSGNALLSQQNYTASVVAGSANSFSFTLDANPANATVVLTDGNGATYTAGSTITLATPCFNVPFTLSMQDAAGDTIVGPGFPATTLGSNLLFTSSFSNSTIYLSSTQQTFSITTLSVIESPADSLTASDGLSGATTQFTVELVPMIIVPTSPPIFQA